jgi:hypothetical protein
MYVGTTSAQSLGQSSGYKSTIDLSQRCESSHWDLTTTGDLLLCSPIDLSQWCEIFTWAFTTMWELPLRSHNDERSPIVFSHRAFTMMWDLHLSFHNDVRSPIEISQWCKISHWDLTMVWDLPLISNIIAGSSQPQGRRLTHIALRYHTLLWGLSNACRVV